MSQYQKPKIRTYKLRRRGECLEWTGAQGRYPMIRIAKRQTWLHRVIVGCVGRWEFACHCCDNPGCLNPQHLFKGSPKSNMQDKVKKGRAYNGADRRTAWPARDSKTGRFTKC